MPVGAPTPVRRPQFQLTTAKYIMRNTLLLQILILYLITVVFVAILTLIGYAIYDTIPDFFISSLVYFVIVEEVARAAALRYGLRQKRFTFWTTVIVIAAGFAVVEISNAFFPEQYASVEARNAPFALLAAFEFIFGFLLHSILTAVMLALKQRIGWIVGFGGAFALHWLWNGALGAGN